MDNDIPAGPVAGMVAVFVRRGPWGHLYAGHPGAVRAHISSNHLMSSPSA
jgi:hypothetical protein